MKNTDTETEMEKTVKMCSRCFEPFECIVVPDHIMFAKAMNAVATCDQCVDAMRAEQDARAAANTKQPIDEIDPKYQLFDRDHLPANARKYYDVDRHNDEGEDTLITGKTGAGKSFLAAGLALELIADGKRPHFTTGAELKQMLTPTDSPEVRSDREQRLRTIERVKWLCIDELGHGNWTTAYAERILRILEKRASKITVITSQYQPSELAREVKGECHAVTLDAVGRRLDEMKCHWKL